MSDSNRDMIGKINIKLNEEEQLLQKVQEMNSDSLPFKTEMLLERLIFESRWLLMPMFLGMIVALLGFSLHFVYLIMDFVVNIFTYEKNEMLVIILTFVDKVLVGGLVIMVIISGYENSVSKLNIAPHKRRLSWLGKLDSTSLKVKLSASIVTISSIHLLKIFLDVKNYSFEELAWTTGIHFSMVITAIVLAFMDKIQGKH